MTLPKRDLDRFLRGVHRRLIVVRALERAGICAAIAAAFALVFNSTMLWRGDNGLPLSLATILLGGAIGLLWGLASRPALSDAAVAADRQLNLSDLLASALALRSSEDPWARAVLAVADQRCRALSPGAVIVAKLGGRAWGGIGLAAALVLTLGALSALPGESPAAGDAKTGHSEDPLSPLSSSNGARRDIPNVPFSPRGGSGPTQMPGSDDHAQERSSVASPRTSGDTVAGGGDGTGATAPPLGRTLESGAASGGTPGIGPAGGGGLAVDEAAARTSTDPAGAHGRVLGTRSHSAPWQSPSWRSTRQGALQAVESGQVPLTYRDVVREYFREGEQ
jgi:hypothetical protein